jgi:hypothetical protein
MYTTHISSTGSHFLTARVAVELKVKRVLLKPEAEILVGEDEDKPFKTDNPELSKPNNSHVDSTAAARLLHTTLTSMYRRGKPIGCTHWTGATSKKVDNIKPTL